MTRHGSAVITASLILIAVASCGRKATTADPCACADHRFGGLSDSLLTASCDSAILADPEFARSFDKCLAARRAGTDTSSVHIGSLDTAVAGGAGLTSGKYFFSSETSKALWRASKVTGTHEGSIRVKSGFVVIQGDDIEAGELVMDLTSIGVTDLKGEDRAKLEGHLRSEDFFQVSSYPEAVFTLVRSRAVGKRSYELTGSLTIRGVDKDQTMAVVLAQASPDELVISGTLAIDRTQYGIRFRSGKFFGDLGDQAIDDVFYVTLNLRARR